jgi:hypothetical protein
MTNYKISQLQAKTIPVDADLTIIADSAGPPNKSLSWANLKATLKSYFDTLYQAILGFTPENVTNKSTDGTLGGASPSDTKYPSQKAAKTYADGLVLPGYMSRLKVYNDSGNPASKIDITADAIIMASGTAYKLLTGVSLAVDCTTNGANGLDTGSLSNGNWYFFYVIYNPTTATIAGLASLSATSPALPSGYTYSRLVSAIYYTSSAFRNVKQAGNRVNVTTAGISMYACSVNSYTSTDISAYVPANALSVQIQPTHTNATQTAMMHEIAWDASGTNRVQFIVGAPGATLDGTEVSLGAQTYRLNPAAPQTIYIKGYDTNDRGHSYLLGYELDI